MRITFSAIVWGLVGALIVAGCGEPEDDAGQIARAMAAMQTGIEARRTGPVLEHLAEDFRTGEDLRPRELRAMMLYQFRRYSDIKVVTHNRDIRVQGDQADVTLDALLLAGRTMLPERGRRYSVSMRWYKLDGGWYLSRIRWQPKRGE
ncbi:MAG: hypothetical protein RI563_03805 [Thiohalophilus sp.]|nr:hypothetical protein [Thiohalophilus sp.]